MDVLTVTVVALFTFMLVAIIAQMYTSKLEHETQRKEIEAGIEDDR